MMLSLLTDTQELSQVFDLYDLKLQTQNPSPDIEDVQQRSDNDLCIFAEANKAYYSYVLDRAWANDILQTEL